MAKILIVHGISNQYMGEVELHREWFPALCDGLNRVGRSQHPADEDCVCAFYGDLFRLNGHLGGELIPFEEELDEIGEDDAELLQAIWISAAEVESEVPGPGEYGDTLVWAPQFAQRALTSLARSKYLAEMMPLQLLGDLKQVSLYLKDAVIRTQILSRVLPHISSETKIVIGHSLGSVIAYEALCIKAEHSPELVTLGSPLGIRNVIYDRLTPPPGRPGFSSWPGAVPRWTNIAARGDIVAAQKQLAPMFGAEIEDVLIESGWDAHSSARYLNSVQAGTAISRALFGEGSIPR